MDVAAIYCRLSKEDQDKISKGDDSASIHNQKMMLVDYALEHAYTVYDIYSDDDFKGFNRDRPEFNRMLSDAKLKRFNTVICKTQSRFTRDMELVEKYIHGIFPLLGIRFIGVVDHVDTNEKGNKKARQINGLINEWYSEDLSENIRSVFRAKMEKGEFLGAFACYGYKKDPNNRHHLIIDEPAAMVVRKIFSYSVQGFGNKQICMKLQQEAIPPPSVYKASLGINYHHPDENNFGGRYGIWGTNTVRRILTNRMYIGDMVQGRERKVNYKSKKVAEVPEEEWIIVPGCHEPIIEKEVFELVQKLIKSRRYAKAGENGEKRIAPLAGKLRCLDCGNKLTRINGQRNYIYYYCSLYKRSGKKRCTPHSVRASRLEELLRERIKAVIGSRIREEPIDETITEEAAKEELLQKPVRLQKQREVREKVKKALAMAYIDKSNGVISENEYNDLKAVFKQELEDINVSCRLPEKEMNTPARDNNQPEDKEAFAGRHTDLDVLNHEAVNELIDYIEVGEKDKDGNQEIIIHWRF